MVVVPEIFVVAKPDVPVTVRLLPTLRLSVIPTPPLTCNTPDKVKLAGIVPVPMVVVPEIFVVAKLDVLVTVRLPILPVVILPVVIVAFPKVAKLDVPVTLRLAPI